MKILLKGNNLASWMIALALQQYKQLKVTVTGKPEQPCYPAVVSALPLFKTVIAQCSIDQNVFFNFMQPRPLLALQLASIEEHFPKWCAFSNYGAPLGPVKFHEIFSKLHLNNNNIGSYSDFSLAIQLAKQGKFSPPVDDINSPFSTFDVGYIFDTAQLLLFCQKQCRQVACSPSVQYENDFDLIIDSAAINNNNEKVQGLTWQELTKPNNSDKFSKQIKQVEDGIYTSIFSNNGVKNCQLIYHSVEANSTSSMLIKYAKNAIKTSVIELQKLQSETQKSGAQTKVVEVPQDWRHPCSILSPLDFICAFISGLLKYFPSDNKHSSLLYRHYSQISDSLLDFESLVKDLLLNNDDNPLLKHYLATSSIPERELSWIHPDWYIGALLEFNKTPKMETPLARQAPMARCITLHQQVKMVFQRILTNLSL